MIFHTQNHTYFYSSCELPILYIPPDFQIFLSEKNKKNKGSYYQRKMMFLKKHKIDVMNQHIDNRRKSTASINNKMVEASIENCKVITFEVNQNCNLACTYCIHGENYSNREKREGREMSVDDAISVLDFITKRTTNQKLYISFYGGEPLLNMKFIRKVVEHCEKIKKVKSIEFIYNLTTNGLLLIPHIHYLELYHFNLLISLDGNDKHNKYRVYKKDSKSSFKELMDILVIIKKNHDSYFRDNIQFNAVIHDQSNLLDIFTFYKKNDFPLPYLSPINPTVISSFYSSSPKNDISTIIQDKEYAFGYFGAKYGAFFDQFYYSFYNYRELINGKRQNKKFTTATCFPFSKKLYVTAHGNFFPCESIDHKYPLGFVKDKEVHIDFAKIAKIYTSLLRKVKVQCNHCDLSDFCNQCLFLDIFCNNAEFCRAQKKPSLHDHVAENITFFENNERLHDKIRKEYYYV